MSKPVNRWQEVLHGLCIRDEVVNPKRIALRLHKAWDYVSDICRRERVDPFAVFNAILQEAEPLTPANTATMLRIAGPIFGLLTQGTNWTAHYVPPVDTHTLDYKRLCEQTGTLIEDLGGLVKTLANIEADSAYNADDDVHIDEFGVKAGQLQARLEAMKFELARRRKQGVRL